MQGTLAALFSGLTIFISASGFLTGNLYGRKQDQRNRGEKGIGTSVTSTHRIALERLLKAGRDIVCYCCADCLVLMYKWLQDYEYRISIQWGVFAIACLLSVLIALFTISFQSIKAAIANPVHSLRTE